MRNKLQTNTVPQKYCVIVSQLLQIIRFIRHPINFNITRKSTKKQKKKNINSKNSIPNCLTVFKKKNYETNKTQNKQIFKI